MRLRQRYNFFCFALWCIDVDIPDKVGDGRVAVVTFSLSLSELIFRVEIESEL